MASFRNHLLATCGWAPGGGAPAFATFTLDSANDACEWFFQSPTSDQITTLVVNIASITGAPGNLTIALHPPLAATGAADTGTTHASATVAAAAGIRTVTIAYTPTLGQNLVMRLSCAGASVGNTVVVNNRSTSIGAEAGWYPLTVTNGAAAVKIASAIPVFGIRTATRSYGFPIKAYTLITDFTTPAQRGVKFTPPADWGDTYQIAGVTPCWRTPAAGSTFTLFQYLSGAGGAAAVQSIARDTDHMAAAASNGQQFILYFTGLTTIAFGSPAYLAFDGSTALRLFIVDFETAGDAAACGGDTFTYISRANTAAAFTEDNTRVPMIDVFLADWTEPVGGGTTNIIHRRRNVLSRHSFTNKRRRSVNVQVAVTQTNLLVRPRRIRTHVVIPPRTRRVTINPVTINNVTTSLIINRRRNITNYGLSRPHLAKRRTVLSTTINNITTTVLVVRPRRVM